jgi:UDP-N-acetylglucosamine 2-epimerase (non-hydrolysing)
MLSVFAIGPDHDLGLMRPRQDIFDITRAAPEGLRSVLATEKPDTVLVQGDTTSGFAAALAATICTSGGARRGGVCTGDRAQRFPGRQTSDVALGAVASPRPKPRENLLREGIPDNIAVTETRWSMRCTARWRRKATSWPRISTRGAPSSQRGGCCW